MITGRQLREALRLLGWDAQKLMDSSSVRSHSVSGAASSLSPLTLSTDEEERICAALGQAGILILDEHKGDLGVRMLPTDQRAAPEEHLDAERRQQAKVDASRRTAAERKGNS